MIPRCCGDWNGETARYGCIVRCIIDIHIFASICKITIIIPIYPNAKMHGAPGFRDGKVYDTVLELGYRHGCIISIPIGGKAGSIGDICSAASSGKTTDIIGSVNSIGINAITIGRGVHRYLQRGGICK